MINFQVSWNLKTVVYIDVVIVLTPQVEESFHSTHQSWFTLKRDSHYSRLHGSCLPSQAHCDRLRNCVVTKRTVIYRVYSPHWTVLKRLSTRVAHPGGCNCCKFCAETFFSKSLRGMLTGKVWPPLTVPGSATVFNTSAADSSTLHYYIIHLYNATHSDPSHKSV